MAIEFDYDAGANRLAVRGELTIYHAEQAAVQLRNHSGAALDLSGIAEMDGAGLQLLLAAKRDAGMRLVAVSDPVADVLLLVGKSDLMEVKA